MTRYRNRIPAAVPYAPAPAPPGPLRSTYPRNLTPGSPESGAWERAGVVERHEYHCHLQLVLVLPEGVVEGYEGAEVTVAFDLEGRPLATGYPEWESDVIEADEDGHYIAQGTDVDQAVADIDEWVRDHLDDLRVAAGLAAQNQQQSKEAA